MTTINMHMKFEFEIPKQTWLTSRKPCHLQSPETKKSNMAARQPFWKWYCWKYIGFYPYTWVLCRWCLNLIFKAKVKLESGNQKIKYGRQAAILKATSLNINRLLPMATINMHMKFEIEIPKQTWLMLRKPCRLQTDGRTDGQTDGQGESSIPPPTSFGGGIMIRLTLYNAHRGGGEPTRLLLTEWDDASCSIKRIEKQKVVGDQKLVNKCKIAYHSRKFGTILGKRVSMHVKPWSHRVVGLLSRRTTGFSTQS